VGFDIKPDRIELMKKGIDPSKELDSNEFIGCDIQFTSNLDDLRQASFHIVAVPTPIDKHNLPDLRPVLGASETVGKILKKGDVVVYESTVYPGCTEEDCIPVLEKFSGLKYPEDFKVGYSPERINPGDKEHTFKTIIKIVSGCDEPTLDTVAKVYELVYSSRR
jgi:UDP-N-acetyl-D-galactosamine dehydrogenase